MRFLAPALPAPRPGWPRSASRALPRRRARRRRWPALVLARAALARGCSCVRLFFVDSRLRAARWLEAHVPAGRDRRPHREQPRLRARASRRAARCASCPRSRARWRRAERFAEAARALSAREASPWLVLTASYYERFLDHPEQRPGAGRLLPGPAGGPRRVRGRGALPPGRAGGGRRPSSWIPEIVVLKKSGSADRRRAERHGARPAEARARRPRPCTIAAPGPRDRG